jgi:hypothetical protein
MKMTKTLDRKEQLQRLRERYARRNKEGKSRMLDELCEQYGYDRKHAIKPLGNTRPPSKGTPPPGPEPRYQPVCEVLVNVWQHAEQLCGKRLAPALALWLPYYSKHFNPLLPCQKKLLQEISHATIDRLPADRKAAPRGLCGTRLGIRNPLASVILLRLPDSPKQGNARCVNFWAIDGIIHAKP